MQDNIAPKGSTFPLVAEQPVFCGPKDKPWPAGKHKAIVDLATGKVFSIVSRDYRLIRHEDAIEFLEKAIQRIPISGLCRVHFCFTTTGVGCFMYFGSRGFRSG